MALPGKPSTAPAPVATASAAKPAAAAPSAPAAPSTGAPAAATDGATKVAIKQFGPAKNEAGEAIAAPTPHGVNLVDLSKEMYASLTSLLAAKGVTDIDAFATELGGIDKTQFPGHKEGRVSYNIGNIIGSMFKMNGLLTKVRGATGGAVMKAKIAEKDNKIAELEAKLAELMKKVGG